MKRRLSESVDTNISTKTARPNVDDSQFISNNVSESSQKDESAHASKDESAEASKDESAEASNDKTSQKDESGESSNDWSYGKTLEDHTQTLESHDRVTEVCKGSTEEVRVFDYNNRVIDYNNDLVRSSYASDRYGNSGLDSRYSDSLEDPSVLAREGQELLDIFSDNPEAVEFISDVISSIGDIF